MRLGTAAWGMREMPLEKQLELTRSLGLKDMELSIAGYDKDFLQEKPSDEDLATVKKLFSEYGINLEYACTGNDFTNADPAKNLEALAKVKRVIDTASRLGIRQLRIFAGFNSDSVMYGERFDQMIACLKEAGAFAKARQVILAIETHGGVTATGIGDSLLHFNSPTTRVDMLKEILSALPADSVNLNYDPANLAAAGSTDPIGFYAQFKSRITYLHLKDFRDVQGGVAPAACGEGRLNWKKLMSAISDFNGAALIEYELPGDVADGMKRSIEFINHL